MNVLTRIEDGVWCARLYRDHNDALRADCVSMTGYTADAVADGDNEGWLRAWLAQQKAIAAKSRPVSKPDKRRRWAR